MDRRFLLLLGSLTALGLSARMCTRSLRLRGAIIQAEGQFSPELDAVKALGLATLITSSAASTVVFATALALNVQNGREFNIRMRRIFGKSM